MKRWTAERWAASSGIAFAIIFVVSNVITGTPPHYNASPEKVGAFLHDHHKALTIQSALLGVLVVLFLWFLSSFAGMYREAGQRRLSTIIYGAGVVMVAVGAAGDALLIAATRLNAFDGPGAASAFYAVSAFFYIKMLWPVTALALATGLATLRSGLLPQWYVGLTGLGAIVFVLGGLSMRLHGFFSPSGAMPLIAFIAFAVWILISSALLVQKTPGAPAAQPAAAQ